MEESTMVMESTRSILKHCVQKKDGLEITNHSITLYHKFRKVAMNTRMVFLLVLTIMKEAGCETLIKRSRKIRVRGPQPPQRLRAQRVVAWPNCHSDLLWTSNLGHMPNNTYTTLNAHQRKDTNVSSLEAIVMHMKIIIWCANNSLHMKIIIWCANKWIGCTTRINKITVLQ